MSQSLTTGVYGNASAENFLGAQITMLPGSTLRARSDNVFYVNPGPGVLGFRAEFQGITISLTTTN